VILVAGSADEPPVREPTVGECGAELLLLGAGVTRELIDRWQAARTPGRVVVAGLGATELDAVVRGIADQLTGRSVGLVLTGGGARALAHIGVIAELLDAGVVIGRVAGCSMGAYIGALLAMGLNADEIDARVYEEYVRRNPAGDYTLPRHALTSGRRGYAMLERSFGDLDVEALPRQLTTTSVDLYRRELVLLSSGKLKDVVAGSIALPGISPPHVIGDRVLVDGGVLDNSPVAPLLARDEGPVILSSVLDPGGAAAPVRTGPPRRPPVVETVLRAMTTGSAAATRHAHESASVVIAPAGRGVGLLEFHQIDRMVEAGRAAARSALAELPDGLLPVSHPARR
jgi:predicted acylesterase/phospholipase RssA